MRKSLWILLAVMVVAFSATNAHADSLTDGTINFTVTSGSPTPTGSFVFDNTTNSFSSFSVLWAGLVFDLTSSANGLSGATVAGCPSAGIFSYLVDNGCGGKSGWEANGVNMNTGHPEFDFLNMNDNTFHLFGRVSSSLNGLVADGTFSTTTTSVTASEPSSVALMLVGVGLVLLLRKRNSRSRQLAT